MLCRDFSVHEFSNIFRLKVLFIEDDSVNRIRVNKSCMRTQCDGLRFQQRDGEPPDAEIGDKETIVSRSTRERNTNTPQRDGLGGPTWK